MALPFEDDFDSYAVATNLPFGNWSSASGFGFIIAGGPSGSGNCLHIGAGGFAGAAEYLDGPGNGTYYSSFTVYFFFKPIRLDEIFEVQNGPNGTGHTFGLLKVSVEQDGTITVRAGSGNEFLGNSIDSIVNFYSWNFIQINATFSDISTHVNVLCEVALNGKQVISRNFETATGISQLTNTTSEVNRFRLAAGSTDFDNFTLKSLQSILTYPHAGVPNVIVPQGVIELAKQSDNTNVQVFQAVAELPRLLDSGKIQIYQGVIELLLNIEIAQGLWKVREI